MFTTQERAGLAAIRASSSVSDTFCFFQTLHDFHIKKSDTAYLMDSACQDRTSFKDIFFRKIPFFWMLRLLAAKFSKSVNVPADSVECMLAETERVEPDKNEMFKKIKHKQAGAELKLPPR